VTKFNPLKTFNNDRSALVVAHEMFSIFDLKQCIQRLFNIAPQQQYLERQISIGERMRSITCVLLETGIYGNLLSDAGIMSGDTIYVDSPHPMTAFDT
jgi:hypothetical protein